MMNNQLIKLYDDMHNHTKDWCKQCKIPYSCCSKEYCDIVLTYAKENGVIEVMFNTNATLLNEEMSKNLIVAGWRFSKSAEEKINGNGKAITIQDLMKENPEGKKVRIIG